MLPNKTYCLILPIFYEKYKKTTPKLETIGEALFTLKVYMDRDEAVVMRM